MSSLQPLPSDDSTVWSRFSGDPRVRPTLRASDADRDLVREVLSTAYTEGRLTHDEHTDRLELVNQARTVGDLVPLVDDVVATRSTAAAAAIKPQPAAEPTPSGWRVVRGVTGGAWLTVAIITNVVWILTAISQGHLYYYWPVWPMFGMAIPVLIGVIGGNVHRNEAQRRALERDERRAQRRDRRELDQ